MPRTKTMFDDPTYIVVNVPSPVAELIKDIRRRFDPQRSEDVVEISLSGSCGLGFIIPGQKPETVFAILDRLAAGLRPFPVRFNAVRRFDHSHIYYLAPKNPEPFISIHQLLRHSGIQFAENPFPYHPHCTLTLFRQPSPDETRKLLAVKPPHQEFTVNTLSVYELNAPDDGQLLHRCNFGLQ